MDTPWKRWRWSGPPISLQVTALLLGSLVVAQAVTLALTLLLPPEPPPQYELADIAAALQGQAPAPSRARPLQRTLQRDPPAPSGPGWLTSERSRRELAQLLGHPDEAVRLYFYTPLPFAGTTRSAPPGGDESEAPPRPHRSSFDEDDDGAPRPMYAALQLAQAGRGPGGSGGAGGFGGPGGGGPRDPGGSSSSSGSGGPRAPGSSTGDIQPSAPTPAPAPTQPPAPVAPSPAPTESPAAAAPNAPSPAVANPEPAAAPEAAAAAAAPPPTSSEGGQAGAAAAGTPPQPSATQGAAPRPSVAEGAARQPPAAQGAAPRRMPQPPSPDPAGARPVPPATHTPPAPAGDALPAAPAHESAAAPATGSGLPPAATERTPSAGRELPRAAPQASLPAAAAAAPRGLFGLAPAPFVEGDFVAATQLAEGSWAVVQPVPAPFPNAWQRRVLLWFLVAAAIVAPLGWLFSRRLTRPISSFAEAAERLGRDPTEPAPVIAGPAEVGRAAHAFNRMQSRLRSFVDDRTAMIGAISHDLRTPLTRMRFRIEDAPDGLREGMLYEVEQMEQMIHSVLSFIRDASEPGVRQRLDLSAIVEDVVGSAVSVGKKVRLGAHQAAPVEADAVSMRRLLDNLIENAVKYGEQAEVRLFTERQEAVAEVRDHGPGLPDSELERVFQPFYRAPDARASDKGGSGLGLAVCRSIARAHGGDVRLQRVADGLVAQVRLPLAYDAAPG